MSDADQEWPDDQPPPKKKGLPGWLWFCGGGCLLAVLAMIVIGFFGARMIQRGADPEIQWPLVDEVLPFDERPEDMKLLLGLKIPGVGMTQWTFMHEGINAQVQLLRLGGASGKEFDKMFDEGKAANVPGVGKQENKQLSSITVQGRELRMLSYFQGKTMGQDETAGAAAFVDLTDEDGGDPLVLMIIKNGSTEDDSISIEDIQTVLAPFHIGPDR